MVAGPATAIALDLLLKELWLLKRWFLARLLRTINSEAAIPPKTTMTTPTPAEMMRVDDPLDSSFVFGFLCPSGLAVFNFVGEDVGALVSARPRQPSGSADDVQIQVLLFQSFAAHASTVFIDLHTMSRSAKSNVVGAWVGLWVGADVVGLLVGDTVGNGVGLRVGERVGTGVVGLFVGAAVVGEDVGSGVGKPPAFRQIATPQSTLFFLLPS